MSVPGVAVTLGARLRAGFGPVLYQSGKLKRVHMRRACDKHFRATVHQLAFTSLSRCPWARQYYDQHRARGHGHHAALRALANLWMRILFRMWKTGQHYDESRFLADRARHASSHRARVVGRSSIGNHFIPHTLLTLTTSFSYPHP